MKTLQLIFFVIIFFFIVFAIFLLKSNPQFIFKNRAVEPNQTGTTRSVIYKPWDYANKDYAAICPKCGPMGGINIMVWNQMNPGKGQYNWTGLDAHLEAASKMRTVPFPDGTTIPKPVIIQFDFYEEGAAVQTKYGNEDYTPAWVYQSGGVTPECVNTDTGQKVDCSAAGNKKKTGHVFPLCNTGTDNAWGVMPPFENTAWQQAYFDFIKEAGRKYNNDSRLTGAIASMGIGAEPFMTKNRYDCNPKYWQQYQTKYRVFLSGLADTWHEAFPNKPVYLTLGGEDWTADVVASAYKFSPPLGLKSNALEADLSHYEYANGVLGGRWPMANFDGGIRPSTNWSFEDSHFVGGRDIYFMTLWVLSGHGQFIDWRDLGHMEKVYVALPKFWTDFVPRYLGKKIDETDSVWTVLRDTKMKDGLCSVDPQKPGSCCWTSYKGEKVCIYGRKGNFEYWLYQLDDVAGGKTVPLLLNSPNVAGQIHNGIIPELPVSAQNEIFAYSLRRTDQATGNKYMYFKIDDNFPMKKEGKDSFELMVVLLNRGSDSFSIEYKTKSGEIKTLKVQKGAGLGKIDQFVVVPLRLEEADLSGGFDGGADFRLSSEGDGDEIVHMVLIGEDLPEIEYTSQPVNPTIPPKPTKIPQTPSPTQNPLIPSSTPTPTKNPLTPSPTVSPTPIPTGTVNLSTKLSLQGILIKPQNEYSEINAKITVWGDLFKEPKEITVKFTCNNQAVWEGIATFENLPLGSGYNIIISVPKHLELTVDDLTLTEGKNNLDFSDTVILAGDINADEVINSYDLSFIRNNLNSSENNILIKVDLNLDGVVNALDFSLAIASLKIENEQSE